MRGTQFVTMMAMVLAGACVGNEGNSPPPAPVDWNSLNAPTTSKTTTPTQPPKLADVELAAAHKFIDAFTVKGATEPARLDTEPTALTQLYAPEATLLIPGAVDAKGPEQILAAYKALLGSFSPLKLGATRIMTKGNVVTVEWIARGGQPREWMGIAADPAPDPVGFPGLSIFVFTGDGHIEREHTYFDLVTIATQLGAGPKGDDKRPMLPLELQPILVQAKGDDLEQSNAQIPPQLSAAIASRDEAAYLDHFAPDVIRQGMGETTKGKDEERRILDQLLGTFHEYKAIDQARGFGDIVVDEVEVAATQVPTKKPVHWRGAEVLQIKDGKIAQFTSYVNRLELLEELGQWKLPPIKLP